jgi:hypothetical protein
MGLTENYRIVLTDIPTGAAFHAGLSVQRPENRSLLHPDVPGAKHCAPAAAGAPFLIDLQELTGLTGVIIDGHLQIHRFFLSL